MIYSSFSLERLITVDATTNSIRELELSGTVIVDGIFGSTSLLFFFLCCGDLLFSFSTKSLGIGVESLESGVNKGGCSSDSWDLGESSDVILRSCFFFVKYYFR